MQTSILKKGWAYFILLAMLAAALLPAAAWAAGGTDAHANGLITLRGKDGREEYYNTLYEAAQAAEDGDIILLNDNIEMAFFELNGKRQKPTMTITTKDIILDGQGHTVTANQSGSIQHDRSPRGRRADCSKYYSGRQRFFQQKIFQYNRR